MSLYYINPVHLSLLFFLIILSSIAYGNYVCGVQESVIICLLLLLAALVLSLGIFLMNPFERLSGLMLGIFIFIIHILGAGNLTRNCCCIIRIPMKKMLMSCGANSYYMTKRF